jgi:hypothetical protein
MVDIRLQQLVVAEARAWRSCSKMGAVMIGGFLLVKLGTRIAGTYLTSHVRSTRPEGIAATGILLQMLGAAIMMALIIPVAISFGRWIGAIWQRRRFSTREPQ